MKKFYAWLQKGPTGRKKYPQWQIAQDNNSAIIVFFA